MKDICQTPVYLSLNASVMVASKKVQLEDIATIFCESPDIAFQIKKMHLFTFPDSEQGQSVVNALAIIERIHQTCTQVQVFNIGSTESVVYYRNLSAPKKRSGKIKAFFLMLLAFFGTAFSIMSYNGDVGAIDLLQTLFSMFTGEQVRAADAGYRFGILSYCIGLLAGMIVFFNHGINHKKVDDPTPLQVQMRLYERDVNDTIVINSARKGTDLDAD